MKATDNKKKAKGQKGKNKQSRQPEPWKKEPPKEGEPLTKTVNNKTYNWCPHHLAWTFHSEADCRLCLQQADGKSQSKNKNRRDGKKSKWLKTLAAICDDFSDDEEDEEDDDEQEEAEASSINSNQK
jgi:hypothetical protein